MGSDCTKTIEKILDDEFKGNNSSCKFLKDLESEGKLLKELWG